MCRPRCRPKAGDARNRRSITTRPTVSIVQLPWKAGSGTTADQPRAQSRHAHTHATPCQTVSCCGHFDVDAVEPHHPPGVHQRREQRTPRCHTRPPPSQTTPAAQSAGPPRWSCSCTTGSLACAQQRGRQRLAAAGPAARTQRTRSRRLPRAAFISVFFLAVLLGR